MIAFPGRLPRMLVVVVATFAMACSAPGPQSVPRTLADLAPLGEADNGVGPAQAAPTANPGLIRVPRPVVPAGPRRVGIQAGHWLTAEVPDELSRLENMTGTSAAGIAEWQVNLDIANRVARRLRERGLQVDVLPTTVPAGYLADVFISLHCDGSHDSGPRGYKAAHSTRRGPYEDALLKAVIEEYGTVTGLPRDTAITRGMTGYYAFNWRRYTASVAPHTPAAILEMGFLTSPVDRSLLVGRPELVADGITRGIVRFLDEVPAEKLFAEDLYVPAFRAPRP
jgi:hypothetical protein